MAFHTYAPLDPAQPNGGVMLLEASSETCPDFNSLPPDRVVEEDTAFGSRTVHDNRVRVATLLPPE